MAWYCPVRVVLMLDMLFGSAPRLVLPANARAADVVVDVDGKTGMCMYQQFDNTPSTNSNGSLLLLHIWHFLFGQRHVSISTRYDVW